MASDPFLEAVPLEFQDAEGVQRILHSHAFLAGNLPVQRLTRADGVFDGFYTKLQFDRVDFENGGLVESAPVILDLGALLRGGVLCSGAGNVSTLAYQRG